MSQESSPEPNAPKKSPLQLKKEMQAKMQSNRAAKEKRPDPGDSKSSGGSQVSGAKPMRSSASKQGG